jgi:hypothetical protein
MRGGRNRYRDFINEIYDWPSEYLWDSLNGVFKAGSETNTQARGDVRRTINNAGKYRGIRIQKSGFSRLIWLFKRIYYLMQAIAFIGKPWENGRDRKASQRAGRRPKKRDNQKRREKRIAFSVSSVLTLTVSFYMTSDYL